MTQPAPFCHPHTAVRLAAALLLGTATVPGAVAATAANLPRGATTASLAQPGWIHPDERRFPTTSDSFPLWNSGARSQWVYRPGTTEEIIMSAGFARAMQSGNMTADASVEIGVSAQARAVATAAGRASASAQAEWLVEVVINPFANVAHFGMPMYLRLLDRFGCVDQGLPQGLVCQPVDLTTKIQHVSTGRFAHSVQPFHEGEATFRETVTVTDVVNPQAAGASATFAGSASYDVTLPSGGRNLVGTVSPSGGWTADDFVAFSALPSRLLSLYPTGDRRNSEDDRNGPMAGEALFAIREADVLGRFEFGVPFPELNVPYPLPSAAYRVTIDQLVTAGFGTSGYGWGTVAADFDNTARTSILSVLDPTGELELDPSILQVYIAPVPEPSALALLAAGLGILGMAHRRRRPGSSA
jgi:hypothetical protein